MLPEALLCLLNAAIIYAQTRQQLSVNTVSSFAAPNPPTFTLPTSKKLSISIALCSATSGGSVPRFFVTNSSNAANPGSSGGRDVFEIRLTDGYGNWNGTFNSGGTLAVENAGQTPFEVGVSDADPLHDIVQDTPLLGDTTGNQAILFSPSFLSVVPEQPSYPNYTLPTANISVPTPPSSSPNFTLFISTTSSLTLTSLPKTGCALSSQRSAGDIEQQSLWLKDETSWRTQWLIGGLAPSTNYTAYVVQDNKKVSGPILFMTKSASFSCPLVASLPYCPGIAYPVPLPAPPSPATTYDASNIPQTITTPLLSYLTNFTMSLLTFACGRDLYSPLVTCADCQREYRRWLCAISFPRCGEPSPSNPQPLSSIPAPTATGLSAQPPKGGSQQILSALVPQSSSSPSRNTNFPQLTTGYTLLQPCLEVCTAVDRACPNFLEFRCPVRRFNAAATYGVGYIDSGEEGVQGNGVTGAAQDRWGNIWCNGG